MDTGYRSRTPCCLSRWPCHADIQWAVATKELNLANAMLKGHSLEEYKGNYSLEHAAHDRLVAVQTSFAKNSSAGGGAAYTWFQQADPLFAWCSNEARDIAVAYTLAMSNVSVEGLLGRYGPPTRVAVGALQRRLYEDEFLHFFTCAPAKVPGKGCVHQPSRVVLVAS
mgnify:CR=1 FL=1